MTLSSLRTQGPITPGGYGFEDSSNIDAKTIDHAVWVPAFAGTTKESGAWCAAFFMGITVG
jgi:hypothetical protein